MRTPGDMKRLGVTRAEVYEECWRMDRNGGSLSVWGLYRIMRIGSDLVAPGETTRSREK